MYHIGIVGGEKYRFSVDDFLAQALRLAREHGAENVAIVSPHGLIGRVHLEHQTVYWY